VYVPVFTFTLSLSHCLWAACTSNMGRGGLPDGCGWGWGVQLEVSADGQTLTGRVVGDIVDGRAKAATLARLAAEHGVERAQVRPSLGAKHMCRVVYSFSVSLSLCVRCILWQVLAVGDGSNDIPMMRCAGASVAYHAKPRVQEAV
jgi:phosphoserine phosphatase